MTIVLKGGTLLDGKGGTPVPDSVIEITDDKFTYVGDGSGFDGTGAEQIIDLSGMTVLPGLVDAHDHQQMMRCHGAINELWNLDPTYLLIRSVGAALRNLREGVTTAREMGAIAGTNLLMKLATERGLVLGPRLVTCGQPIAMTGGHAYQLCVEADGVNEVRKAARQQLKAGADFIKLMTSKESGKAIQARKAQGKPLSIPEYSEAEIRAAVEEAHNAGKKALAHSCGDVSIRRCINAGIDCIEHANYLDKENAALMAERGIFLVPTIAVHKESQNTIWERGELKAEDMKYLFEAQQISFKNALEAGVPLAVGTDALGDMALEMQLMIEGGLAPMDAIVAATRDGAQLLDLEDEVGTVEPGKLADIVVIRGNPLEDMMLLREVEIVIKQGDILRPDTLPNLPPYSMDEARSQTIGYKAYNESLLVHNV